MPVSAAVGAAVTSDIAMSLARSKHDLAEIRQIRFDLLTKMLAAPERGHARALKNLKPYERAALAKQKRALRKL